MGLALQDLLILVLLKNIFRLISHRSSPTIAHAGGVKILSRLLSLPNNLGSIVARACLGMSTLVLVAIGLVESLVSGLPQVFNLLVLLFNLQFILLLLFPFHPLSLLLAQFADDRLPSSMLGRRRKRLPGNAVTDSLTIDLAKLYCSV